MKSYSAVYMTHMTAVWPVLLASWNCSVFCQACKYYKGCAVIGRPLTLSWSVLTWHGTALYHCLFQHVCVIKYSGGETISVYFFPQLKSLTHWHTFTG